VLSFVVKSTEHSRCRSVFQLSQRNRNRKTLGNPVDTTKRKQEAAVLVNKDGGFHDVLESDLRALSAEARRRYPAVKDAAEHAILKLRSLAAPNEIAHNEDILRIFVMACEVKNVKLSVIGLSCLQKLISHDAIAPSALKEILSTLKEVSRNGHLCLHVIIYAGSIAVLKLEMKMTVH
ncbi:hypothetical protein Pfo_001882, partial [Paulownia fortunei]